MLVLTTFVRRFVYFAVNTFCMSILIQIMSKGGYKIKNQWIVSLILALASLVGGVIFAGLIEPIKNFKMAYFVLLWVLASAPTCISQVLMSTDTLKQNVIVIITQFNVVVLVISSMYYLSMHLYTHDFLFSNLYGVMLYAIIGLMYYFFFSKRYRKWAVMITKSRKRIWLAVTFIPAIFLVLQGTIFAISGIRDNILYILVILLLGAAFLVTYVVIFFMLNISIQKEESKLVANTLSIQNNMWEQQLNLYENLVENTRRTRHDLRHHDRYLLQLLEEERVDDAKAYVKEHFASVDKLRAATFSPNKTINNILASFASSATEQEIELNIEAMGVPEKIDFVVTDLCAIIFNLAENALHACQVIEEGKKFINISISYANGALKIEVKNSAPNGVTFRSGSPVRKEDPSGGIGTKSVKLVVDKYNGMIDYTYEDNVFCAHAVLFEQKD